jgi:threonine/homoserine/homoserine lactone efflux protein
MVSGLGVATADSLYGLLGGLGLTVITSFLIDQQLVLRMVGGLVLLGLGLRIVLSKGEVLPVEDRPRENGGMFGTYSSIFLLTLSNPMTIMSFAAIYAGLIEPDLANGWMAAASFALAIFLGSACWWLVLVSGVNFIRDRFAPVIVDKINKFSGVLITGIGLVILVQAFG